MSSSTHTAKKVKLREREEDPPLIEPPVPPSPRAIVSQFQDGLTRPIHDPSLDPHLSTGFGPWMQVTRRTPSSTAGPRTKSPTQGMAVGSRGSRFMALTPEVSYDAPMDIPQMVDSTRPLVGHASSRNDQRRQKSLSPSSKRVESHKWGSILGASGNNAKSKGVTSSSHWLNSSLGLPAHTSPSPSPPLLEIHSAQLVSKSPAPLPPPPAASASGPTPPDPSFPQPRPSEPSPTQLSSSHVVISLSSHVALVSPNLTFPQPIPAELLNGATVEVNTEPPDPMDTSSSQPNLEDMPPDPTPELSRAGDVHDSPDTTMEDTIPSPVTIHSLEDAGQVVPVPTGSS
ncbi:hypothetical protein K2173_004233 [Erythroxylum novogranatense]|uniref:Uncharacterized protein n=1 Tax=Erythroxylum novogranatense TaxID=1862640 RepID=A0AAV8U806_9ROSI|nr:hypothetical protein K2173_004233 [Erythroxylum novogranatense]